MQGKQLDPIPLLLPLNLLLLVPFGHLLEKVKTKVLERWCALPLSLLYSFSAAAVTASWQLHTVNRFMKAMCIQALPSTLLSCQEQNNLGNVYSSRSIHIVYVYSSPCVHIHHVYLSSTYYLSLWHVCVSIWYYYQIGEWWSSLLLRDTKLSIIRFHWGSSCLCDMFMKQCIMMYWSDSSIFGATCIFIFRRNEIFSGL